MILYHYFEVYCPPPLSELVQQTCADAPSNHDIRGPRGDSGRNVFQLAYI